MNNKKDVRAPSEPGSVERACDSNTWEIKAADCKFGLFSKIASQEKKREEKHVGKCLYNFCLFF